MFLVNPYIFNAGTSLINELSNLALLTNLKVCLDAGDPNSYPGTGQTWFDLSGNGNHFYRGTGSGTDGADPTYTPAGNGGTYREYFSVDGGDYFTKATANDTFFNSLHKDNAAFTIIEVAYANDVTHGSSAIFHSGDGWSTGNPAIIIQGGGAVGLNPFLEVATGTGGDALNRTMTAAATDNSWNLFAISEDEAAGTLVMQMNATQETSSGTYTSPSSSNAGVSWQIGSAGNGHQPENAGDRIALYAMWNRALSTTELTALYGALKNRFSLP